MDHGEIGWMYFESVRLGANCLDGATSFCQPFSAVIDCVSAFLFWENLDIKYEKEIDWK